MKRYSKKRASIQTDYIRNLNTKMEDWDGCCEGCSRRIACTPSHLIPRSFDRDLISHPDNFHFHCQECANLCETGEWEQLQDGRAIFQYIESARPDYLAIKQNSFFERHGRYMNF